LSNVSLENRANWVSFGHDPIGHPESDKKNPTPTLPKSLHSATLLYTETELFRIS